MKIFYIANIRLPTEKAHGIQIMEMCSAFVKQGYSVELIVPRRRNSIKEDPFTYHNISKTFSIRKLPCVDFVRFGRVGFLITLFTFINTVIFFVFLKRDAIFYTRDELIAVALRFIGKKVVWEGHTGQKNFAIRLLMRAHVPIVVITKALRDMYISLGYDETKILVAPDGADIDRFNIKMTQREARKKLGLPANKKIILYKGHLYERKGAHTLARAATCLEERGIICVFIGGTEKDVATFKKEFSKQKNVYITGNRPRKETPIYQRAADLLVIPNSAKGDISKLYTSPMKLFGYMASGVPIVASDIPAIKEIISDSHAFFFTPDEPISLCNVIIKALDTYDEAKKKAKAALVLAEDFSWDKRAEHILKNIL